MLQANLLRQAQFGQLDITNLIEEIEDMGKNRQRELGSRLQTLISHLLKWQYEPNQGKRLPVNYFSIGKSLYPRKSGGTGPESW